LEKCKKNNMYSNTSADSSTSYSKYPTLELYGDLD
jgi:hypothetical protein